MIIILLSRYEDAAVVFSKSQLSFEEVALKFIQVCEDYCMHVMTTHPVTLHVSRCIYCVCLVITKYLPLSVYLSVCLSVCLSVSDQLSICISFYLPLSVCLSVCLSLYLSLHLPGQQKRSIEDISPSEVGCTLPKRQHSTNNVNNMAH